ncbi:hypothetical protein R3W88_031185 [Solanum pinnatisectum]|uniref:BHLH domain-containing protein n=1 Tax=Solanum pinnatisectum TaxID=50273 RepID=A0AAV9LLI9_9SOLN|nr:hypothetical protein R3W88_031185 [Solanum pinnatisectum]
MALETVVYPQKQYNGYVCKEFYSYEEQESSILDNNLEYSSSCNYSMMQNQVNLGDCNIVEENSNNMLFLEGSSANSNSLRCCTKKRKRTCNNKDQRMIHIAVERNRRKQMNDYLTILRSLMPSSYVQRADQASIIGGAINFVKELEHNLQTLQAKKAFISRLEKSDISLSPLFADFFSFPRYSNCSCESLVAVEKSRPLQMSHDIQVNLVESHVNLKILSKRRPKQLMKIVVGLQCLWPTILHLNVTTVHDQIVLYSITTKLEEGCQLTTLEEISHAVNQLLDRIQEEEATSSSN